MDDVCKAKMGATALQDMRWRTVWIIGREYYRAKGSAAQMSNWDTLAKNAYPDHAFNDGDPGLNAYAEGLRFGEWTKWFPGWSDDSCSFDQKKFACFCYWLASLDAAQRSEVIDKLTQTASPVEHPCADAVTSDPIYIVRADQSDGNGKSSMWPWLIGLAALGAVGAVIYHGSKE